jgi:hypothetical protein
MPHQRNKPMPPMPSIPKEVQVAKITAKQAIAVALITALAGTAGAAITAYFRPEQKKPEPIVQHYIRMPVKLTGVGGSGYSVRIVAEVNGHAYSYPSRAVWADVTDSMESEAFPLPIGTNQFAVRFLAFVRKPDGSTTTVTNAEKISVTASSPPRPEVCSLQMLDNGFVRSHALDLAIYYQME